jgi:hypothetical protein
MRRLTVDFATRDRPLATLNVSTVSGAALSEGLLCGDLNNRRERKVTMDSFRAYNNATLRSARCQERNFDLTFYLRQDGRVKFQQPI